MDFWDVFICFLFMFIIFSCCGYCCTRKRRGAVLSAPIVVTSSTHTAPGGYPVTQMPAGATMAAYQPQVYAAPYPTQGAPTQMPMPMPMPTGQPPAPGVQPYMAPYAPVPAPANMNPPSYDMAVGAAGSGVANNATYEKQAPYNPNYTGQ
uniref:Putative secreted protein n=2 Tax=Haematobia irritans TaxID=7368 RepID=A0A1L8EA06_HAEIR